MYKEVIRPILDHLDSEAMHIAAREGLYLTEIIPGGLETLQFLFAYQRQRFADPRLNVSIDGINFDNPLIVGAGWDKPARAVEALYALGFAGVEIGTVTAWDQDGNPKPRQKARRGVANNRLGFNNIGMNRTEKNLKRYAIYNENGKVIGTRVPIGISLGKNREVPDKYTPFAHSIVAKRLYDYATWFAINVSSPNTPNLRALQDKGPLSDISDALIDTMNESGGRIPWFIKIAPDLTLTAVDDVIDVALSKGASGIIAANTTINEEIKAANGWQDEMGGFSGDDPRFAALSNRIIAHIFRQTEGKLAIIGVGGVHNGHSAMQKIFAGASALEAVTGIRGEGTTMPGKTNSEILATLDEYGANNISELIGIHSKSF